MNFVLGDIFGTRTQIVREHIAMCARQLVDLTSLTPRTPRRLWRTPQIAKTSSSWRDVLTPATTSGQARDLDYLNSVPADSQDRPRVLRPPFAPGLPVTAF